MGNVFKKIVKLGTEVGKIEAERLDVGKIHANLERIVRCWKVKNQKKPQWLQLERLTEVGNDRLSWKN